MRLILSLRSRTNYAYFTNYYHKLQGFIYSLFRRASLTDLHDKVGPKFFSFSNIFPIKDAKEGDLRYLLIASPENRLMSALFEGLLELADSVVNIGHMSFTLEKVQLIRPRIRSHCRLLSATPIVIRIPRERFKRFEGQWSPTYRSIYWREQYPMELFLEQLTANLAKKYRLFFGQPLDDEFLFTDCRFLKQTCNNVVFNGKEVKIIGSIWEFNFANLSRPQQQVVEFILDSGLGELNSVGFGFVNQVKRLKNNC